MSVLHDEQDFDRERELIVVDVKRKGVCHLSHNVSIGSRSYPPPIDMTWVDGTHLLFGETKSGQVLDAPAGKLAAPTGAQRQAAAPPVPPDRERKGLFDSEWGKLWFAGDKELAGSVLDETGIAVNDMEISGDGKWAAFCESGASSVFLLDGAARRKHQLLSGWAYNIKWLPAVDTGK